MKKTDKSSITDILARLSSESDRISECIKNNIRFIAAGYKIDYEVFTTDSGIEFILSRDLQGNTVGIDYHFSEDYVITMELDRIISEEGTSHLYSMKLPKGLDEIVPVKILCPDVLAAPKKGDLIDGQSVAFSTDNFALLDSSVYPEGVIKKCAPETVLIEGEIFDGYAFDFELGDMRFSFWELLVRIGKGAMPVILLADENLEPEIGDYLSAEAIFAIDVAIDRETQSEQPLHEAWGLGSTFNNDLLSADGLVPNLRNAERVLAKCLEEGNLERFRRCISKSLAEMTDKTHLEGPLSDVLPREICDKLMELINLEDVNASTDVYLSDCKSNRLLKGSSIIAVSSGKFVSFICMDIDRYGFVDDIRFISPEDDPIVFYSEFNALSSIARALKGNKINIIKEYLANKCVLHTLDNTLAVGLSGITYFLENLVPEASDRSDIEFRLITTDIPIEEYPCTPEYIWEEAEGRGDNWQSIVLSLELHGSTIGYLSAKFDSAGLVTDLYFSRGSY